MDLMCSRMASCASARTARRPARPSSHSHAPSSRARAADSENTCAQLTVAAPEAALMSVCIHHKGVAKPF